MAPGAVTFLTWAIFVTVIAMIDAERKVLYPKYKPGGLACYKDNRSDYGAFWTYANDQQRRDYIFHCPSSLSAWCVNVMTDKHTVRGCSGPSGINKAGCFHVVNEKKTVSKVCLCKKELCNAATGPAATWSQLAFVVVSITTAVVL